MRVRSVLVAVLSAVMLVTSGAPANAVLYGEPDGNGHPFVGLVVFYDDSGKPLWRCSGALLSSRVFLTAGHCTFGTATAQVWFDSVVTTASGYPYTGGTTGTPIPHPAYDDFATFPNTHDVGVVVLDRTVKVGATGSLAALGTLDSLATKRGLQEVTFKLVGYGLQGVKPTYQGARERYVGWTKVNNLSSALTDGYNIQLSSNPGNWSGGVCFGDSGGPVFLGDTRTVVAVNSFVLNYNCTGNGFAYRTDIADSWYWISSFLR